MGESKRTVDFVFALYGKKYKESTTKMSTLNRRLSDLKARLKGQDDPEVVRANNLVRQISNDFNWNMAPHLEPSDVARFKSILESFAVDIGILISKEAMIDLAHRSINFYKEFNKEVRAKKGRFLQRFGCISEQEIVITNLGEVIEFLTKLRKAKDKLSEAAEVILQNKENVEAVRRSIEAYTQLQNFVNERQRGD